MVGAENWIPCFACSTASTAEMRTDHEELIEYEYASQSENVPNLETTYLNPSMATAITRTEK